MKKTYQRNAGLGPFLAKVGQVYATKPVLHIDVMGPLYYKINEYVQKAQLTCSTDLQS